MIQDPSAACRLYKWARPDWIAASFSASVAAEALGINPAHASRIAASADVNILFIRAPPKSVILKFETQNSGGSETRSFLPHIARQSKQKSEDLKIQSKTLLPKSAPPGRPRRKSPPRAPPGCGRAVADQFMLNSHVWHSSQVL